MRYVVLGKTATLIVTLPVRPSGAGTAVVRTVDGGQLETVTPTLDSVSTTITADVAAGKATLTVASATGVTRGRRYLLDGPEDGGGEQVTVTGISSLTLTLARVLRRAHASSSTFVSTRLSFAITTASTGATGRNLRIEWTDPDTSDVVAIPFDVVRWSPVTSLTSEDLRAGDPLFTKRIPGDTWLPDVRDSAWDKILDELATKGRVPGAYAGTIDLTRAHGYLTRALLAESFTRDAESTALLEDLRKRYRQELDGTLAGLAYDDQGTGRAETGKGQWQGFPLVRG
jgi:hypothetical protein